MIDYIVAHKLEIFSLLLALSELLGFSGKGGIFKVAYDFLKKASGKA